MVPVHDNASLASSPAILTVAALTRREIVRFFRQRNRVVGAIGQPVVFWLLFGAGMHRVFRAEGQSFVEYFFPGTVVMILLFTAIFATISVIEDRREGFLQGVLVAPVPRWAMVSGKIVGGATIAVAQACLFLLLAWTVGIHPGPLAMMAVVAWLVLSALALTGLGFLLAWRMDSTQGFHAIMNLLLMPMWLLSGAFFPVPTLNATASVSDHIMHWLMRLNPVTYVVGGLRQLLYRSAPQSLRQQLSGEVWLPSLSTSTLILLLFVLAVVALAARAARRPTGGDLQ